VHSTRITPTRRCYPHVIMTSSD
jgi:ferritin-like metal-binding protein YciE